MPAVPAGAFDEAEALGIHPIVLDTPFGVGPVNTYLIDDDPLTLIDCGPNTASALEQLEQGLADLGRRIADLEQIVVTHQHVDHIGLAGTLARRSGAELITLDQLAPLAAELDAASVRSDDDALALMLAHGVEPHVAEALRSVANLTRGFGAPAQVGATVHDGGELRLAGRVFQVQHRPGHSPSDTVLFDPVSGVGLLGDHLLAHISSNALLSRPLDLAPDKPLRRRPQPLLTYRSSLEATRQLDMTIGLTGHGQPINDHRELIDRRLAAHLRRAEGFLAMLDDGPLSAHEIATRRWGGQVAVTQAFLTLSEVLGHLDLLIADGVVREDDAAEVIHFERT